MKTYTTPLRFVSVGHGSAVCANHVLALLAPKTAPSKRILSRAKKEGQYLDMTAGRGSRSLLLMTDGKVIGSSLAVATMLKRLNAGECETISEEDA